MASTGIAARPGKETRPAAPAGGRALPWRLLLVALFWIPAPAAAQAWAPVIERLAADGFDRPALEALFARPEVRFEADAMAGKLRALLRSRSATEAQREARRTAVQRDFLSPHVIARAHAFRQNQRTLLAETEQRYGVPAEVVVAILLIETRLGEYTGNRIVFNRLASMALAADWEALRPHLGAPGLSAEEEAFARRLSREKGEWAYGELRALLWYAQGHGGDPLAIRGSIYGAIGQCQFMPSNLFLYGVDADGDGRVDPFATADALHSIANYLRGHGWQPGLDREGQHRVVFGYNHSTVYANTVLAIAERLRALEARP